MRFDELPDAGRRLSDLGYLVAYDFTRDLLTVMSEGRRRFLVSTPWAQQASTEEIRTHLGMPPSPEDLAIEAERAVRELRIALGGDPGRALWRRSA